MNLEYWKQQNDEKFAKAIDVLADSVIEEYVCDGDFDNATDLDDCDSEDIQHFYSLLLDNRFCRHPQIPEEPFSIKEFNKENTGHLGIISVFENYVSDIWEESLDDELVEAIRDRIEVGKIVNKYALGGGGFEVERDLELGTCDKVAEKLKNKYKQINK